MTEISRWLESGRAGDADAKPDPSRRTFCLQAGRAGALAALGAFGGCSTSTDPASMLDEVEATVSGSTVSVVVTDGSVLSSVGGFAAISTVLGSFLLYRSSSDAFTVLDATCTHQGCLVDAFTGSEFVCPCHGSRFTTTGAVSRGPASEPLPAFANDFDGQVLTFTV